MGEKLPHPRVPILLHAQNKAWGAGCSLENFNVSGLLEQYLQTLSHHISASALQLFTPPRGRSFQDRNPAPSKQLSICGLQSKGKALGVWMMCPGWVEMGQVYTQVKWGKVVEDGLATVERIPFSCRPGITAVSLPPECMPAFFLHKDMCHQSCPQQFYKDEDTHQCLPCHKDCLECSGPSADNCDLCAKYFSYLYDGQCLDNCPKGTYYERKTNQCKGKDFRVHDQVMNPREPDGIMGLGQDQVGCGVCSPGTVVPPISLIFWICPNLFF